MSSKRSILGNKLEFERKGADVRLRVGLGVAIVLAYVNAHYSLVTAYAVVFTDYCSC